MEQISRPHDRFFKEAFSRLETARDFVRHYLPEEITALLNLETLEITKDSFVDEELKERFSDLVYRVDLKEDGWIFVYLLFEHKSYPERDIALYLLSCMAHIWTQCLKQEMTLPLPAIIPLVVYHGKAKWQVSRAFQDMVNVPAPLKPLVPAFEYRLWDLSKYTDDEIKGGVFLKVSALLMKHIFSENIGEKLPGIFKLLQGILSARSGLQYLEAALRYAASGSSHVKKDDLVHALKEAFNNEGGGIMATLAEQWINEGVQKGIQQGLRQGMEKGMEKGMEQGMVQEAREMVLEAVTSRFGTVPEDMALEVNALDSRTLLKILLRQAVVCTDLAEFRKALNELKV